MPEFIRDMYRKAGYKPPEEHAGKHKRPEAHAQVIRYMKKHGLSKKEAWKRVMGGFGKHVWAD